jgi:hypothetical protein
MLSMNTDPVELGSLSSLTCLIRVGPKPRDVQGRYLRPVIEQDRAPHNLVRSNNQNQSNWTAHAPVGALPVGTFGVTRNSLNGPSSRHRGVLGRALRAV